MSELEDYITKIVDNRIYEILKNKENETKNMMSISDKKLKTLREINKYFHCTKPTGESNEVCGKMCVRFSENSESFITCIYFRLKEEYSIFEM